VDVNVADSAAAPPVRELRADAARNRARVIGVVRELIDSGDLSLPMNSIAKLAEVGVGTVYRHFPTRQTLLEAVAAEAFEALIVEASGAALERDPAVGLERLLRRALELLVRDRSFAAVLSTPGCEGVAILKLAAQLGGSIATVLERARNANLIRQDIGPEDLRRLICGIEHAVRAGSDGEAMVDLYLDVLLQGLRGPGRSRSRSWRLLKGAPR
jgi:AcrR family transcriptional regulator